MSHGESIQEALARYERALEGASDEFRTHLRAAVREGKFFDAFLDYSGIAFLLVMARQTDGSPRVGFSVYRYYPERDQYVHESGHVLDFYQALACFPELKTARWVENEPVS